MQTIPRVSKTPLPRPPTHPTAHRPIPPLPPSSFPFLLIVSRNNPPTKRRLPISAYGDPVLDRTPSPPLLISALRSVPLPARRYDRSAIAARSVSGEGAVVLRVAWKGAVGQVLVRYAGAGWEW